MTDPADREVAIFGAALNLPAGERAAYLDQACAGDGALRQRVEAFLAANAEAGTFLEGQIPAARSLKGTIDPSGHRGSAESSGAPSEKPGDRIGRYKLLEQIGEGGCGVVYMAEQERPVRRKVALKVIKLGMDTKSVIARFEAERQALALMDHPNIAKVLEAGATDAGRPFFVMELVRGTRITDFCDQNDSSTRERLVLFIQVCSAIQHAHQKGIIHRDIKPSNILVTVNDGVAVPMVIDFGIAKATQGKLTDQTLFTAFEQFLGTPAYMSPEQAVMTNLDIDTRSDIYSLGVLLYELLTGKTPFDGKELLAAGLDEMRRTIQEKEPERPSTRLSTMVATDATSIAKRRKTDAPGLIHSLRGDLDWIVMKALEKDRARRYETANGLGMDVRRHLNDEPVVARPPGKLYRFQKLVRRNKLAFAAAASVTLALLSGLGIAMWSLSKEKEALQNEANLRVQAQASENKAKIEATHAEAATIETRRTLEDSDFSQAVRLCSEGHFADALPYLSRILSANPTNGSALTRLVTLLTYHSWMVPTFTLNHSNWVYSASFSPDGQRIVTGSYDNTARVWDAQTGTAITPPLRHEGLVESAEFSPDGKWVATGSSDGNAWVWDARTGQPIAGPLKHGGMVYRVQFSPEGTRIVTASTDGTARIWETMTGRQLIAPLKHDDAVHSAEFSPDGKRIVTASYDNTARVWDARTGQPVTDPLRHDRQVLSARFSPDGKWIVTASWDNTARIWNAQTGIPLTKPLKHDDLGWSAEFSPDGEYVVTTSMDRTARVWDALTGQLLTPPLQHDSTVRSAHFSPDGERLVTASQDTTARVWDARSGQPLTEPLKHGGPLNSAQFSPDGRQIVTASYDNAARVWDSLGGQPLNQPYKHKNVVSSAQFSPDGRRIVTSSIDRTAQVWDALNGKPVSAPLQHDDMVRSAEFSADGQRIVTASLDRTACVWDAQTGRKLATLKHGAGVSLAEFSPDGRWILTASYDNTARVWDAATGVARTDPLKHEGGIESAEFSPDGKWVLTGSFDGNACVWDAQSGRLVTGPLKHGRLVCSAHFSPDGKRIVTGTGGYGQAAGAWVWDAQTGLRLAGPLQHMDAVKSARFSPDGRRVVTASWDHTARVWDAQTGLPLTPPMRHGEVLSSARFSPDGRRIVTASDDKTARVWDADTGLPLTEPLEHGGVGRWAVGSAEFSPDGNRVVTASDDGTARVWDVAPAKVNCPEWLLLLAEAISGRVLDKRGLMVETKLNRADVLRQVRQKLQSEPDDDDWVVWGRWFLAEPAARTISPFSKITVHDHILHRLADGTAEALDEVKHLVDLGTAESVCREALADSLKLWPDESAQWQSSLCSLVAVLALERKYDEAARAYNRVLKPPGPSNLLINGSFESGSFIGSGCMFLFPGAYNITGWTVVGSPGFDFAWISSLYSGDLSPADGAYFLDLTGAHDSVPYCGVAQTIRTLAGNVYDYSFALGSDFKFGGSILPRVAVEITGNPRQEFTVNAVGTNRWQVFHSSFKASTTNTTLTFTGANTNNIQYIGLDNVVVTASPNPVPGTPKPDSP